MRKTLFLLFIATLPIILTSCVIDNDNPLEGTTWIHKSNKSEYTISNTLSFGKKNVTFTSIIAYYENGAEEIYTHTGTYTCDGKDIHVSFDDGGELSARIISDSMIEALGTFGHYTTYYLEE